MWRAVKPCMICMTQLLLPSSTPVGAPHKARPVAGWIWVLFFCFLFLLFSPIISSRAMRNRSRPTSLSGRPNWWLGNLCRSDTIFCQKHPAYAACIVVDYHVQQWPDFFGEECTGVVGLESATSQHSNSFKNSKTGSTWIQFLHGSKHISSGLTHSKVM